MRVKIFGSAGAGKTTTTSELATEIVRKEEGNFENVYGLSLTRAAKWSLIGKLARDDQDRKILSENILTLHSFAYRRFKAEDNSIRIADLKTIGEFFTERGLEFRVDEEISEDFDTAYGFVDLSKYEGNRLYQFFITIRLSLMHLSIHRISKFINKYQEELPVSGKNFINLLQDFLTWLRENNIWDFTRLLTELYKRKDIALEGLLLIVDEAQDIAPINAELLTRYLDNFKYVIIAGDDDQAIFSFASATPDFMLNTPVNKEIILPVSYRLPRAIWKLARKIIDQNRNRKYKDFKPRNEEGFVDYLYSVDDTLERILKHKDKGERIFILTRNRVYLQSWVSALENSDIPYTVIGKGQKLPTKLIRQLRTVLHIKEGKTISEDVAFELIRFLKIGRIKGTTHAKIAKVLSQVHTSGYSSSTPEGKIVKFILESPIDRIFAREDRQTLYMWWRRVKNIDEWSNPKIKLGTIHSAKGLEADVVVLDHRITRRVYDEAMNDIELERRVAYVGVTRARQSLYLVRPPGGNYDYFNLGIL